MKKLLLLLMAFLTIFPFAVFANDSSSSGESEEAVDCEQVLDDARKAKGEADKPADGEGADTDGEGSES